MIGAGYALRLDRIGLNVRDLPTMVAFYTGALGFEARSESEDAALASLLGTRRVRKVVLARGKQTLELTQCDPPGRPYPEMSRSNDLWFQHCALVTPDIRSASERLSQFSHAVISREGPQALEGGIVALKFRDPEGHPLELIQFAEPDPRTEAGIDHSAISVGDVQRKPPRRSRRRSRLTSSVLNRGASRRMSSCSGTVSRVGAPASPATQPTSPRAALFL